MNSAYQVGDRVLYVLPPSVAYRRPNGLKLPGVVSCVTSKRVTVKLDGGSYRVIVPSSIELVSRLRLPVRRSSQRRSREPRRDRKRVQPLHRDVWREVLHLRSDGRASGNLHRCET